MKSTFQPRISSLARPRARFSSSSLARPRARFGWTDLQCGVALSLAVASGCARVAPYERETLARRDMELADNAELTAGEEHAEAYREGSSGGGSAKGGGCGCN